jgi:putative DNA primase/helicase
MGSAYADDEQRGADQMTGGLSRFALTTMDAIPEEEQAFLWEGFIPDGALTLIEGDPDVGKSFMALDLAARISTGRAFPDGEVADQFARRTVLFLTAEDSLSKTVKPRLIGCGADLQNVISQETKGDGLLLPRGVEDLRAMIRGHGIKVIVLDALNNYLDASEVNVNKEQEVRQALKPLRDLAAAENVAIIGLRHLNKRTTADPMYRGGGSIALAAVARSVLLVARHPDGSGLRIVIPQKANLVSDDKKGALGFQFVEDVCAADGKVRPRIAWEHDVTPISTGELLAPRKPGPSPVVAENAERFLLDLLVAGPRNRKDVMLEARKVHLNEKAVDRAAGKLSVASVPSGNERIWSLPATRGSTDRSAA